MGKGVLGLRKRFVGVRVRPLPDVVLTIRTTALLLVATLSAPQNLANPADNHTFAGCVSQERASLRVRNRDAPNPLTRSRVGLPVIHAR